MVEEESGQSEQRQDERRLPTREVVEKVQEDFDNLKPNEVLKDLNGLIIVLGNVETVYRHLGPDDAPRAQKINEARAELARCVENIQKTLSEIVKIAGSVREQGQSEEARGEEIKKIKNTIIQLIDQFKKELDNVTALTKYETITVKIFDDFKMNFKLFGENLSNAVNTTDPSSFQQHKKELLNILKNALLDLKKIKNTLGYKERRQERQEVAEEKKIIELRNKLTSALAIFENIHSQNGMEAPHLQEIITLTTHLDDLTSRHEEIIRVKLATEKEMFEHLERIEGILDTLQSAVNTSKTKESLSGINHSSFGSSSEGVPAIDHEIAEILEQIGKKIQELRLETEEIKEAMNILKELNDLFTGFQQKLTRA